MKVVEQTEVKDQIEKIEIPYKHINESAIIPAIQKIMNAPILPVYPTGYWIGKTGKKFLKTIEQIQKDFQKLLDAYAEKDEKGAVMWAGPREPKIVDGKKEEFEAKEKEFFETNAVIETMKFKLSELAPAKLNPNDIMALEPMLDVQS